VVAAQTVVLEQHPPQQEGLIPELEVVMVALVGTVVLLTVLEVEALVDIQETAGLVMQVLE